ncbi:hypothetical protein NDU88_009003 [Pleurodeles waltl]|uniref:Uncharacterized protein n=1 Tax=Pleurodeles waltl TaxID=8319 RepID=A0AAV7QU52_PLEWA|nr:hypothetical protein NDU88_009003 [Pleurodeles waltl]
MPFADKVKFISAQAQSASLELLLVYACSLVLKKTDQKRAAEMWLSLVQLVGLLRVESGAISSSHLSQERQQRRTPRILAKNPVKLIHISAEILAGVRVTASFRHRKRQGSRDDLLPAPAHILL